jgi:molybdopterin converting factor small subunit
VKVRVRLFAVARQVASRGSVELELPEGATIGRLRGQLGVQVPALAGIVAQMMFAVDMQYANDETRIPPHADVACIPPVSGG